MVTLGPGSGMTTETDFNIRKTGLVMLGSFRFMSGKFLSVHGSTKSGPLPGHNQLKVVAQIAVSR
jgi:hypothetical protein